MAGIGFYDENSLRAYPLRANPPGLPTTAIADFGATAGVASEFDPAAHSAYLAGIARDGDVLTFSVASDCPGLGGSVLLFRRQLGDPPWTTQWADATLPDGSPYDDDPCGSIPAWSGFLATGPLGDLFNLLADGDSIAGGPGFEFEPCLVRSEAGGYVRAINVGNADRLRATPPGIPAPPAEPAYFANGECLVGPIRLVPGYNCAMIQDASENSITVSASAGAGEGSPCGEVPTHEGEAPPEGSIYLTGGPSCKDLISSINGLTARQLKLVGRDGVIVYPDERQNNLLHVVVSLQGLAACPGPPVAEMALIAAPPQVSRSY